MYSELYFLNEWPIQWKFPFFNTCFPPPFFPIFIYLNNQQWQFIEPFEGAGVFKSRTSGPWDFASKVGISLVNESTVGLREATVRPGVVNGVVMTAPGVNEEQAVFLGFFLGLIGNHRKT